MYGITMAQIAKLPPAPRPHYTRLVSELCENTGEMMHDKLRPPICGRKLLVNSAMFKAVLPDLRNT